MKIWNQSVIELARLIMKEKNTLVTRSCVRLDCWFRDIKFLNWGLEIKFVESYFFLENYGTSEGAVSHDVLYHQPLPITRHQERFYANNYFKLLPTCLKHYTLKFLVNYFKLFSQLFKVLNRLLFNFLKAISTLPNCLYQILTRCFPSLLSCFPYS